MKFLQMLATRVNSMLPPPTQRVLTSGNFAGVASVVNTAIPKTKTRKNINQPEKPRRSGILTASWSRFLVATCTALLFSLIFTQSVTAQTISNKTVAVGSSIEIDLDNVFSSEAGALTYNIPTTTAMGIAAVSIPDKVVGDTLVAGSTLIVTGVAVGPDGSVQIAVTASDGRVVAFEVTVTASAPAPVITAIDTVLNSANEQGIICITFDTDVTFDRSPDASFLNARLGNFVLSSDRPELTPALKVTKFAGHCSVDSVARNNAIHLTLNRQIVHGEIVTLSYTKSGDEHDTKGIRRDGGSKPLADFSNKPVMNNAIQGLDLRSAETFTQANKILLTFGIEQVTTSSDLRAADFVVSGAVSNPVVTGISNKNVSDGDLGSSALVLTLSKNIVGGEDILLSYAKTAGSITGHTEGELANFDNYSVTNHRPPPPLPVISISAATVTATVGSAITDITIDSTTGGGGAVVSYGIAPDIGNGLLFDANTGTISGAPTAAANEISYIITATNSGGTATATVAITVNAAAVAAPIISISAATVTATVGSAITDITIDSTTGGGGAVVSYGIAPDIGNGLLFDANTGTISGAPTAAANEISYIITATNSGGTATATVAITVNAAAVAAPIISISAATVTATVGSAITDITIDSTTGGGGAVVSYGIAPDIGNGLLFDANTGTISGAPTAAANEISYIITATNSGGTATATVAITVNAAAVAAPIISISAATVTATVGSAITDITIDSTTGGGGAVVSYGIAPDIGNGLLFDANTGTISGAPTAAANEISYIITATNSGGTATATVAITVNAAAVAAPIISISAATVTATVGSAITDITIDSTTGGGGAVVSYGIAPDIGNGLLFDANTGTISGAPTAAANEISYIITATNSGGTATATVAITVNAAAVAAPIISISAATVTATVGSAITDITIDSTTGGGGAVVSYGIAPDIGNGLLFDANTGTISGAPTAAANEISYIITATNSGGTATATVAITVNAAAVAAPIISISAATVTATVGSAITDITIDSTTGGGGAVVSYGIAPDIGNGLLFDANTGTISGAPTAAANEISYIITATNSGGTATATVAITVNAAAVAAPIISISAATVTATVGSAITDITIDSTTGGGGAVVSYGIAPDIGNGLLFDANTGTISGAPTAAANEISYIITATNSGGTATATVAITVNAAAVAAPIISISAATVTATVGSAIADITIDSTTGGGGAVVSYGIAPDIGNGLLFDANTGTISGAPTAVSASTNYTITATNSSGLDTAMVAITVTATGLTPDVAKQLNENILPRLTHVMLGSTVSAVNSRMDDTFSGTPQVASYQFDGQTVQLDSQTGLSANLQNTVAQKLPNYLKSLKDGTMDWREMLSRSAFVMPLNAAGGAGSTAGATVWGGGDYNRVSGKFSDGDWKGEVFSVQLGIDQRLGKDMLAGGLVSWSKGDVDYTLTDKNRKETRGDYTHQITSVHPYFARSNGDVDLWGSVGYGQGKLAIKQQSPTEDSERSSDTRLLSLSAGGSGRLTQYGQSGLKLKSDIILAQVDIAASADKKIPADKLNSQRLRLLLEMGKERPLSSGGHFKPLLEVGLRYDGGVGESSGIGAILGFGGRYANTTGLTVEGRLHTLLGQDDYQEWGIQGTIRQQANANGQGLSFSVNPSYGTVGISTNQVWQQELADDNNGTSNNSARLNVNMGYGLFTAGGLLTPYSEVSMSDSNHYRLGLRWKPSSPLSLHLYGERETSNNSDRILLEGRIRF